MKQITRVFGTRLPVPRAANHPGLRHPGANHRKGATTNCKTERSIANRNYPLISKTNMRVSLLLGLPPRNHKKFEKNIGRKIQFFWTPISSKTALSAKRPVETELPEAKTTKKLPKILLKNLIFLDPDFVKNGTFSLNGRQNRTSRSQLYPFSSIKTRFARTATRFVKNPFQKSDILQNSRRPKRQKPTSHGSK